MKNWSLPPMLWYYENGCLYKKLKFQAWSDVEWIEYIPPTSDIRYHGKCAIGCDDSTHCES